MTLFNFSLYTLNTAAFVYLAACLVHFVAVARSGKESHTRWALTGAGLMDFAFLLHTTGLVARWYLGGIGHPPWTNLYESLLFFAWGVSLLQVVNRRRWQVPLLGALAAPLIFILMGMSVMTANKEVEPLIPALQSHWLKIHVVFGMIAYGAFTVAACFAFLQLLRNRVSTARLGAGLALITLLNLGIAGGREMWETGRFHMARTALRELPNGKQVLMKDTYREYEGGPVVTRMAEVPQAHYFYWSSVLLFAALAVWGFARGRSGEDLQKAGKTLLALGLLSLLAFFTVIGWGIKTHPELTLAANPYLVMLLTMTFFFDAIFWLACTRYEKFLASLPSADRLDELSYKNILFGFPFQTLLLITGAIWAYYAWGRSWGWDPKETWALITWFAFLIYLHGKLLMNWKANFLSVLTIIGFVIMVFAFLGVNLVLSGLHSYGSA